MRNPRSHLSIPPGNQPGRAAGLFCWAVSNPKHISWLKKHFWKLDHLGELGKYTLETTTVMILMQNDIEQTLLLQASVGCSTCEMREQKDDHPCFVKTSRGQLWSIATSIAPHKTTTMSSAESGMNEFTNQHAFSLIGERDRAGDDMATMICDKAVAWDDWMKHKIPLKHLHICSLKNREKHIISWSCQHCHLCVFTFFVTFFVLVLLRIDDIAWSPFGDKRHQLKA